MDWIIEFIKKEWTTLSSAPFTFVVLVAVGFLLAYSASSWRYSGIIDELRVQIECSRERIGLQNERIQDYKDRLSRAVEDKGAHKERRGTPESHEQYSEVVAPVPQVSIPDKKRLFDDWERAVSSRGGGTTQSAE